MQCECMRMASVARCGGGRLSSFRLLTHHRHHSLAPSFSTSAIGVDVRQNPPLLYLSKPPLYSQLSTASPPPLPSAPSPSSSTSSTSDPPSASKTRSRWRYSIVAASAIALGVAIRGPEEVKVSLAPQRPARTPLAPSSSYFLLLTHLPLSPVYISGSTDRLDSVAAFHEDCVDVCYDRR